MTNIDDNPIDVEANVHFVSFYLHCSQCANQFSDSSRVKTTVHLCSLTNANIFHFTRTIFRDLFLK